MTRAESRKVRAWRVLVGRTRTVTVPATLIGHLWENGGDYARAVLSTALDGQLLDACHVVATDGVQPMRGTGNVAHYGARRGHRRAEYEVDGGVIRMVMRGEACQTTIRERHVLVRILTDEGWSAERISKHLGIVPRHVHRLRSLPVVIR